MNDYSDELTWVPYDSDVTVPLVLAHHKGDKRAAVQHFIRLTKESYAHFRDQPL